MTPELREHEDVRTMLPELAANATAGDDRARALEHLSGCLACRAELAALAELMDDVLLLAPAVEPPAGFAETVLARLGPVPAAGPRRPAPVGPRPRPRVVPVPAAAAAAVLVGLLAAGVAGAAVWDRTAADRRLAAGYRHTLDVAHGQDLQAAPLYGPGGRELGTVFAYQGEPSWVYVTFRSAPDVGRYQVALVTTAGRELPLRAFTATATSTGWGSTVAVDIARIRTLRFAGDTLPTMTARLS